MRGASRIESLTADHPNARSMNAAFEKVRRAELRRYNWGFAIRRATIPADGDQTEWGEWNRFAKPADMLRLVRDNETGQRVDWRIEGGFIVTADSAPLEIKYVADITDPNAFDDLFVEAFAAKLAWRCCKEITGSTSAQDRCNDDYKVAIAEATRVGALEKDAQEFVEDDWLNARL